MGKFFEDLDKLNLTELLDAALKMQVDYSWQKEAECIEGYGLKDAKRVLDIGTGNGYFLSKLAKRYPEKEFVGIEVSEPLVQLAHKRIMEDKLSNVEIKLEKCPSSKVDGKFDFILARLAIYCAENREDIFAWAYKLLNESGRMCVIDVDDDWIYAYPPNEIFAKLFSSLRNQIEMEGADRAVGKKLPSLLRQADFKNIHLDIGTWYSSHELASDKFVELFSIEGLIATKVVQGSFSEDDYHEYVKFLGEVTSSKINTVIIPMFVASGEK